MPRICDECQKVAIRAANRSHAKNKTLRRQKVNLQKWQGLRLCTRCMRTKMKVAAA